MAIGPQRLEDRMNPRSLVAISRHHPNKKDRLELDREHRWGRVCDEVVTTSV